MPSASMTSISPGLTSRSNWKLELSRAQDSEATATPWSLRPRQRGAHAEPVAHGNKLVLAGEDHQGEGAAQLAHGVDHGLLDGIGVQRLIGDQEEMTSVSLVAAKSQP